jgi:hypothetical protein
MIGRVSSFLLLLFLLVRAFHNNNKIKSVVPLSGTFLQKRPFQVSDKTAPISPHLLLLSALA